MGMIERQSVIQDERDSRLPHHDRSASLGRLRGLPRVTPSGITIVFSVDDIGH